MCIWCYKAKSFTKKLNGSVYISQTLCFVHWTIQSLNLSLNVAFLIKSFLVSTFRNLNFVKRLSGGYQKSCQEDLCNVNNSLCLSLIGPFVFNKSKIMKLSVYYFHNSFCFFYEYTGCQKKCVNWRRPYLLSAE